MSILLSGCGGGSSSAPLVQASQEPAPALTGPLVTVQGRVRYEKVSTVAGSLGRTKSLTVQPARLVDVFAHDAQSGAEIQKSPVATDQDGAFAIDVPKDRTFTIGVRASTTRSSSRVNLDVRDPETGSVYLFDLGDAGGQPFSSATSATTTSVELQVIPATPSNRRPSAVFSILDAAVVAADVARFHHGSPLPLCSFLWSPASTDGTFYQSGEITLKGGDSDNDDTDEFDDSVIVHEYGHHVIREVSRDSSLGGAHTTTMRAYPMLAFDEGFADFFALAARGSAQYVDASGVTSASPTAFVLNGEGGRSPSAVRGIRSELTVLEVLWDLVDGSAELANADSESVVVPFSTLFAALKSLRDRDVYVTLIDYFDALVAAGVSAATIQGLLAAPENQRVTYPATGGDVYPVPISIGANILDTCETRFDGAGDRPSGVDESNRYFKLVLTSPTAVTIRMSLQNGVAGTNATGTNLDLYVLKTDNRFAASAAGPLTPDPRPEASAEGATGVLAAGTYIINVSGWPGENGTLANRSSHAVSYRLQVTSP